MKKDYSIKWFKIKCSLYDQEFGITHWGDVVEFVNSHIGFDIEIKGQTTDPFTDVDAEYCDGKFVRM